MGEQTQGKQEAKEAKPMVRKVRLREGVFLNQEMHEIDLEGRWGLANKASVEVYAGRGALVRYQRTENGKPPVPDALWVPDGMIRQIHVAPEWKP